MKLEGLFTKPGTVGGWFNPGPRVEGVTKRVCMHSVFIHLFSFQSNAFKAKLQPLFLSLHHSLSIYLSESLFHFLFPRVLKLMMKGSGGASRNILDWRVKQPASRLCVGAHCRLYSRSYPGS